MILKNDLLKFEGVFVYTNNDICLLKMTRTDNFFEFPPYAELKTHTHGRRRSSVMELVNVAALSQGIPTNPT